MRANQVPHGAISIWYFLGQTWTLHARARHIGFVLWSFTKKTKKPKSLVPTAPLKVRSFLHGTLYVFCQVTHLD